MNTFAHLCSVWLLLRAKNRFSFFSTLRIRSQRNLSDFKKIIGVLAQNKYLPDLAQRLTELPSAVTVAAAVVTVQAAAPNPRIAKAQAQLQAARAAAEYSKAEAEKWGAIQQDHEGPFVEARPLYGSIPVHDGV